MSNGLDLPFGGFKAPRIPLDLRCIILASGGFLTLFLLDLLLGKWWGDAQMAPIAQMMGLLATQIGKIAFLGEGFTLAVNRIWGVRAYDLDLHQAIVTSAVFFAVWSVFGGALLRCAALKLTRDEPFSLGEAFRFGFAHAKDLLLVPFLVAAFAGFFSLLNMLVGLVMSLWLVGSSLLSIVLFPLALVSSLLVILSLVGGIVGLPLMWAGISVERNGALEAVSRAYSYISARPFHFFFTNLLIMVLMSAVMLVGGFFEGTVKETLKAGIVRSDLDDSVSKPLPKDQELFRPDALAAETRQRAYEGIGNIRNLGNAHWTDKLGFFVMWAFLSLFVLGFKGYALYILLGGTASLYLHLRREVDGTDEEDLFLDGEEEGEPAEAQARWVGESESGEAEKPESGEAEKSESGGAEKPESGETEKPESGEAEKPESGGAEKPDTAPDAPEAPEAPEGAEG